MKVSNNTRRLGPTIAGKIRRIAEPALRELEGVSPPQAPDAVKRPAAPATRAKPETARRPQATLTGWSTEELMMAVRNILKSGRAVARGRFLNLRV